MTCGYCGETKDEHQTPQTATIHHHVKVDHGAVTALKGEVIFIGDCAEKAQTDESWEL